VDRVEQRDCIARLVRLEPADEVEPDAGISIAKRRPLRLRFLHLVLGEVAVARFEQRPYRLGFVGLGDGDQLDLVRRSAGERGGAGDPAAHLFEPFGCVAHRGWL
jgi:hypothetical protein